MDKIYKGKTKDERIQLVYDLTLQNTNGRETHDEMYFEGVKACYEELCESDISKQSYSNCDIFDVSKMLPTDEEIKEIMTTDHYHYETGQYRKIRLDRIQGAKIIRDLIKKRIESNFC